MNEKERSIKGGMVWSAMCAIVANRPLGIYDDAILVRAHQMLARNGGKLPIRKKTNGNGKSSEQSEFVNAPRGSAVAKNGHWAQILRNDQYILLVNRDANKPPKCDHEAKIAELEKTISDLRAELEKVDQLKRAIKELTNP